MPYVAGGSLTRLTRSGKPLDPTLVLRISRQLASALHYAHTRGLIHRDLKPGNVLIDDAGNAFLTDFGLARSMFNDSIVDPSRSQREGTAPYMAPEVAAGQAGDTRCDIYGLGALIYEMLTGRPPYEGETRQQIINKILKGPPTPMETLNPKAPPALVRIAQGAMERELRDRYATMADVLEDLERVEQGAMPLGPKSRAGFIRKCMKGKRRRCIQIGTLGGAILLAIVGWRWLFPPLQLVRQIEFPLVTRWAHAQLGDWNGDKKQDIYTLTDKRDALYVLAPDRNVQPPWERPAGAETLTLALVTDINHDGKDDAFVNWTTGTNLTIQVLNQTYFPIKTFHALGSETLYLNGVYSRSTLVPRAVVDLEADGRLELLAEILTGRGIAPRGLVCFDYESSTQRWFYPTGPTLTEFEFRDLNGDGRTEVVFGSYSPDNGNYLADGTDDRHAYLYAVTHEGTPFWRPCELGKAYTQVHPLPVNPPGARSNYVYAWVAGWPELHQTKDNPEVGRIVRLNLNGELDEARFDAGVAILSCVTTDLEQDGQSEILLTDRLGYLHVLDLDFKPKRDKLRIATVRFDWVYLRIAEVAPLRKDARPHVILTCSQRQYVSGEHIRGGESGSLVCFYHDNEIVVLDSKLNIVTRHTVDRLWLDHPGWTLKVVDMDNDNHPEIVSLADKALIFRLR